MLRHLRRATASHRTAAAGAAHCDTNRQLTYHKVQQRGIAPRPLGKARVATIARPTRYVSTSRSQSTSDCRRPPNDNVSAQVWRLVLKAAHIDFDSKPTGSTCAFVRHPPWRSRRLPQKVLPKSHKMDARGTYRRAKRYAVERPLPSTRTAPRRPNRTARRAGRQRHRARAPLKTRLSFDSDYDNMLGNMHYFPPCTTSSSSSRDWMPSLRYMLRTCVRTVFSDTPSSPATYA